MKIALSILIILFCSQVFGSNLEKDSLLPKGDSSTLNVPLFNKTISDCLGAAYKWGGETLDGFDCSGFVKYVYHQLNIQIPHSSREIAKLGTVIELKNARKGDLLIFTGYKDRKSVGHIGIVLENQAGNLIFIHSSSAPKKSGVVKTNYYQSNYPKRFIKIIRLI